MFCECFTIDAMIEQAQALKQKNTRPGFDNMTADAAIIWLSVNGEKLIRELHSGHYRPMPAVGFTTAKMSGHFRQLSKLTVIDSILQLCALHSLTPIFEGIFVPQSFAFRPGRGVNAALSAYCTSALEYTYCAKLDITSCFDNIEPAILQAKLQDYLPDQPQMIRFVLQMVRMPLLSQGQIVPRDRGVLQGAPLSPLICNIYLHTLDLELQRLGAPFIRYADDIVIFANDSQELRLSIDHIAAFLNSELHMTVRLQKTKISAPTDMLFLGHRFIRDKHGTINIRSQEAVNETWYTWHDTRMRNTHRTVDLLSDGVLRQKDFSLLFETDTQKNNIPVNGIDRINIYSSVIFDTGFLEKVQERHIYVSIFDKYGSLTGHFVPFDAIRSPRLIYDQLSIYYDENKRLFYARQFVLASIHNLRLNLRYYRKQTGEMIYDLAIETINGIERSIKDCKAYEKLLLLEASARKEYYDCFDHMIKSEDFVFSCRSRRPPRNEINALLSFGNMVLYNQMAFKINRSSLDVRVGFLHATNAMREQSLNLDLSQIFRPLVVDRVIFTLINRKVIKPEQFIHESNDAVYLTNEGKHLFLQAYYSKLDETLTVKEKQMTYDMLMDEQVRKLTRAIRHEEKYRAYRQVR